MNRAEIKEGCRLHTYKTGSTVNDDVKSKYHKQKADSTKNSKDSTARQEKIVERRKQIPDIHRANYDKAIRGRSMKAGVKAFCLECTCWQKEEVRLCTDLACPLYPYRPYRISKQATERRSLSAESTNTDKGVI